MPDTKPTRQQQRAQAAFRKISAVKSQRWKVEYGRQCMHLPTLIHQCGLCQALAFLEAKGADEKKKPWFNALLNDLADVTGIAANSKALTEATRRADVLRYQQMSREALACAQWLQRYAEAILKIERGAETGAE